MVRTNEKAVGVLLVLVLLVLRARASRVIALDSAFNSERTLVYRAEEVRVFDPGRRRSYEEDIRALLIDDN